MRIYRVKFTGPKGGWTARLYTNPAKAAEWAQSRLDLDRQVVIQYAETPGWEPPISLEELG